MINWITRARSKSIIKAKRQTAVPFLWQTIRYKVSFHQKFSTPIKLISVHPSTFSFWRTHHKKGNFSKIASDVALIFKLLMIYVTSSMSSPHNINSALFWTSYFDESLFHFLCDIYRLTKLTLKKNLNRIKKLNIW